MRGNERAGCREVGVVRCVRGFCLGLGFGLGGFLCGFLYGLAGFGFEEAHFGWDGCDLNDLI